MCAIAGIVNMNEDLRQDLDNIDSLVCKMGKTMINRGPDDFGSFVDEHVAFSHARLKVIDPAGGAQPMIKSFDNDKRYVIVYNGEIYNTGILRKHLINKGYKFITRSDTEVILNAYIEYREECVKYLDGIFAFAVWDSYKKTVFLARDRFGVKPLFYARCGNNIIFASEIKALFAYPGMKPRVDEGGLCEVFGIGPARTPGCGVFKGVDELKPGYVMIVGEENIREYRYYQLGVYQHKETYRQTVAHTRELLTYAITSQLESDVPLCTLLSGGIDSSIVSSVAARYLRKNGKKLCTYSFTYEDNEKYFQANKYQPESDEPYAHLMAKYIGSSHTVLTCDYTRLYTGLFTAVIAKDLPGMADVDSSLLFYAGGIKKNHTVCLSGECADEVFGGYPWFMDEEWFNDNRKNAFPWTKNIDTRTGILRDEVCKKLNLNEYVNQSFTNAVADVPLLDGEDKLRIRQREINYLNIRHFMTTLLDRKDRMTMRCGLEVRVPFACHKLVEYLYNVPWEYKCHNGVVKGLLRDAMSCYLPDKVIRRKKSPYPKTYDPKYDDICRREVRRIISDVREPVNDFIDRKKVGELLSKSSNVVNPWFGQLMAGPQLFAYIIQVNYWLKEYNVDYDTFAI